MPAQRPTEPISGPGCPREGRDWSATAFITRVQRMVIRSRLRSAHPIDLACSPTPRRTEEPSEDQLAGPDGSAELEDRQAYPHLQRTIHLMRGTIHANQSPVSAYLARNDCTSGPVPGGLPVAL
jgi:hypothetical protein